MVNRFKRGFTTVEMLVSVAILSLAIAMGIQVFFQSRNQADKTLSGRLALQVEARRAADRIIGHIREGAEVIRPFLGESRNYLLLRDAVNHTMMVYLITDQENSLKFKRPLYKLISYENDYSGSTYTPSREKLLASSLQRVAFTLISPNSVQVNATIADDKAEYQFLTHVGLLNFGGGK